MFKKIIMNKRERKYIKRKRHSKFMNTLCHIVRNYQLAELKQQQARNHILNRNAHIATIDIDKFEQLKQAYINQLTNKIQ